MRRACRCDKQRDAATTLTRLCERAGGGVATSQQRATLLHTSLADTHDHHTRTHASRGRSYRARFAVERALAYDLCGAIVCTSSLKAQYTHGGVVQLIDRMKCRVHAGDGPNRAIDLDTLLARMPVLSSSPMHSIAYSICYTVITDQVRCDRAHSLDRSIDSTAQPIYARKYQHHSI